MRKAAASEGARPGPGPHAGGQRSLVLVVSVTAARPALAAVRPLRTRRRSAAPSPRGGSPRTPKPPGHPGSLRAGMARETLGMNNSRGWAALHARPAPGTVPPCALRAAAGSQPRTATRMWHGICSRRPASFHSHYSCTLGRTSLEDT